VRPGLFSIVPRRAPALNRLRPHAPETSKKNLRRGRGIEISPVRPRAEPDGLVKLARTFCPFCARWVAPLCHEFLFEPIRHIFRRSPCHLTDAQMPIDRRRFDAARRVRISRTIDRFVAAWFALYVGFVCGGRQPICHVTVDHSTRMTLVGHQSAHHATGSARRLAAVPPQKRRGVLGHAVTGALRGPSVEAFISHGRLGSLR